VLAYINETHFATKEHTYMCVCVSGIMTHESVAREEREELGISDTFVRFSVGLEDAEDLIADLDQALRAAVSFTDSCSFHVNSNGNWHHGMIAFYSKFYHC